MRGWKDLELVETIYEEEDDHEEEADDHDHDHEEEGYSSNSPSLSPTLSPSPPTPLQSIAKTWSLATGIETDVVIHVQDQSFHLHKDPLISKSGHLKRALRDTNQITLSPPLNITAETFASIVDYCYTYQIVITPFNVAALKVATQLLEMETDNGNGTNCLRQKTENYFCKAVSVNREFACVVLRSSLALLPEAESASMASRCIEALTMAIEGDDVNGWVDEVVSLSVDKFQMIADSLHERFGQNHDLLYRLLDLYLQEHTGEITEEQKIGICSSVDCNRLSPHLIVHAVQNPRMPLRFIVRAMLFEQLQTRRSIVCTTTTTANTNRELQPLQDNNHHQAMTLGALLQRDAAFRQVAQLKESMEATSCKIESLEKDLMNMKRVLDASKKKKESLESGRSMSFSLSSERKIERGERRSHSTSLRFTDKRDVGGVFSPSSSSDISITESLRTKKEKRFGWKLMNGLKNVLKIPYATPKHDSDSRVSGNGLREVEEDGAIIIFKEDSRPSHTRSRSVS